MEGQLKRKLTADQLAAMKPEDFRKMMRGGAWDPEIDESGCCIGYTQHFLVTLPSECASDFHAFCIRNPLTCYVADVSDRGASSSPLLAPDADVRTDCYRYRVFKDGGIVDEPYDVVKYWQEDLVTFFLPCTFNFEHVFLAKHVNWRSLGGFTSNIRCVPAGRFKCDNLLVGIRVFPSTLDAVRAIQITSQLPVAQGYPVHIGDPKEIGIDVTNPDFHRTGQPLRPPQPGEVCMTWALAGTPLLAIKAARPPLALTTYPGYPFISDRRTEEFQSSFRT
ncbi:MAG: DUF1445 domain-containing protein [Syntrophales bacterium LBB04]|nr:DUF1445 domain-containing protein [Syntrophales bacterium LBB04]